MLPISQIAILVTVWLTGFLAGVVFITWLDSHIAKRNREKFRLPVTQDRNQESRQTTQRPQLSLVAHHETSPVKKVMP